MDENVLQKVWLFGKSIVSLQAENRLTAPVAVEKA